MATIGNTVQSVWVDSNIEVTGKIVKEYNLTYLLEIDDATERRLIKCGNLGTGPRIVIRKKGNKVIA